MSIVDNQIVTTTINDKALTPWAYGATTVRTVLLAGEPWFIAADICAVLEISNVSDAVGRLDEDEKGIVSSDTLGGIQQVSVISESGLYKLVFTSRKPEARSFQKWVTGTVLPSIRKTGAYSVQPPKTMTTLEMIAVMATAAAQAETRLATVETTLSAVSSTMQTVESKLQDREKREEENRVIGEKLVPPSVKLNGHSARVNFKTLMDAVVLSTNDSAGSLYTKVYDEVRRRVGIDFMVRLKNAKARGDKKATAIGIAEQMGYAEHVYAVAYERWGHIVERDARRNTSPDRRLQAFPEDDSYLADTDD